jgi:hypothetical protein
MAAVAGSGGCRWRTRVLLVALYRRTNLTMRQVGSLWTARSCRLGTAPERCRATCGATAARSAKDGAAITSAWEKCLGAGGRPNPHLRTHAPATDQA